MGGASLILMRLKSPWNASSPFAVAPVAEPSAQFGGLGQYDQPKSVSEADLQFAALNGNFVRIV